MNKAAIYDSKFVVGLVDEDDKWHRIALELHALIKTKNFLIVYLDCVANEVLSVTGKRFEESSPLIVDDVMLLLNIGGFDERCF